MKILIVLVLLIVLLLIIAVNLRKPKEHPRVTEWKETNAEIIASNLHSFTYGNEFTQGKRTRFVTLTIRFLTSQGHEITATKKVAIFSKYSGRYAQGEVISVLYDAAEPERFKIKYDRP
ncbi:DUF3592 domain-containing protein [Listeria costaricensis]|uniref:DUF3592 domain-containing protein n=1 Tax=Listeria costaricensis TaxID=2026604 RepID=UPI000C077B8C|nr:DUF3592 domain-containing protein [Listeria costaricensis]